MYNSLETETGIDGGGGDSGVDYVETIALLQEEVARLEQELRWREQGPSETTSNAAIPDGDEVELVAAADAVAVARAEVERLEAELAGREETIGLLLDQLSRVEEAQAGDRAEWEHLAGWLAELEQRVEGQDGDALLRLQERLATQQQQADELRRKAEQDRRAGEAQRQVHEGEIARLRAALDRLQAAPAGAASDGAPAAPASAPDSDAVEALRSENLRLRAAWEELTRRPDREASEARDAQLAETLTERDELRRQMEQIQDERRREQLEQRAALAELQAELSRASLARSEVPPVTDAGVRKPSVDRDAELRFQALRHHLLEIHQQEAEQRKQKQLLPRLSRLWSRTGPR